MPEGESPDYSSCGCGPDFRRPKPNGTCASCGGWLPGEKPPSLTAMWRGEKPVRPEGVTDEIVERAYMRFWVQDEHQFAQGKDAMRAALEAVWPEPQFTEDEREALLLHSEISSLGQPPAAPIKSARAKLERS
jgi:hypothetical protein